MTKILDMDTIRKLPALAATAILVVSLLSGPSVGLGQLSRTGLDGLPGEGSASVEVVSVPVEGSLDRARYASRGYVLSIPPATVDVSNLSGHPMVVYKFRFPEMNYVTGTNHVLDERFTGRQTLTLGEPVLNRTSFERDAYRGELMVIKRVHERDTVLYRGNVTLQVNR